MNGTRWDELIEEEWSESWDSLPEAPAVVPRAKTAQITLRMPPSLIARIKRVAGARSLPYHALARSWIVDALRREPPEDLVADISEPHMEQLNIKLDQSVLDGLKQRGHELGIPYHRLARRWIAAETRIAEQALGVDSTAVQPPPMKELMVLLLHATNRDGRSAVRGITRLQKLLFVIEQQLNAKSSFYAYNFGPFDESVNDASRALEVAGFIKGTQAGSSGPPSFREMMSSVSRRATPSEGKAPVVEFALSDKGHEAAERLRHSNPAYEQLFSFVESVKQEWDTRDIKDLIARVYEEYPAYAEKSVIREEMELHRSRRGSK